MADRFKTFLLQAIVFVLLFQGGTLAYGYFFPSDIALSVIEAPSSAQVGGSHSIGDKKRYVRVETNKLSMIIDRLGGRIVQVSFPEYRSYSSDASMRFLEASKTSALNAQAGIVGDEAILFRTAQPSYKISKGRAVVALQAESSSGVRFSKEFQFDSDAYSVGVFVRATNGSERMFTASSYHAFGGEAYSDIEGQTATPSSKDVSFDGEGSEFVSAIRGYSGISYTTNSKPYVRVKYSDMASRAPDRTKGGWLAFQKHQFLAAWSLQEKESFQVKNFWREGLVAEDSATFKQAFASQAVSAKKELRPGDSFSERSTLFVGPQKHDLMAEVDGTLRLTFDYGFFWMFASFLHKALRFIHTFVPSWGWSLVVLIAALRLVFFKSTRDQALQAEKLNKMKPEKDALEARFAGRPRLDPEMNEARLALYKKHGIQMMSLAAFLPLLQLPLLLAFYGMITAVVDFRAEHFLWLNDLAAPDPFYVLPVFAAVVMYLQSAEMSVSEDFKLVARYMPVIFLFFGVKFPAALQLYIGLNTGLGVLQNKLLAKKKK
ncbi:membrane protein insertase YidC [Candidatus Synchoanobacter obligatus]|uniref:Membrane protein insertase YidC n=1 Tax=Candidatus Synchoanobacter obligatus TaxID=2919597 RepID=A0ABT1L4U6_9GAMM|nr:membrane protein insertase YidC [Candidatus Synchoanobacter obligatus]MCP8352205.1 membrane protein insertase YidC [Candidatus Synchoanobacter obligatus]